MKQHKTCWLTPDVSSLVTYDVLAPPYKGGKTYGVRRSPPEPPPHTPGIRPPHPEARYARPDGGHGTPSLARGPAPRCLLCPRRARVGIESGAGRFELACYRCVQILKLWWFGSPFRGAPAPTGILSNSHRVGSGSRHAAADTAANGAPWRVIGHTASRSRPSLVATRRKAAGASAHSLAAPGCAGRAA